MKAEETVKYVLGIAEETPLSGSQEKGLAALKELVIELTWRRQNRRNYLLADTIFQNNQEGVS